MQKIEEIVSTAMKAPTCGNMQLYSIIVTQEKERLQKLASYHFNQPASTTAPVILTICADFNRFTRWCRLRDADEAFNNFHSFITAMTDAVILAQQIVTIAEMQGFGTCYLGTVNYNAKEISDFLKLPDLVVPVASLSVGYIDKEGETTSRLMPEAVIHMEKYRVDSDAEILNFYKEDEENPQNQKFVKENNKKNLAQVFSEIRYPRASNERVSETFLHLIKEKGFLK